MIFYTEYNYLNKNREGSKNINSANKHSLLPNIDN